MGWIFALSIHELNKSLVMQIKPSVKRPIAG